MTKGLTGIHHVSTLSADIGRTNDFFTRILGLRLVLKSVNQDSPDMYHLFFGDGQGTAGSDITVFGMKHAAREHRGNNSITKTTFRVAGEGTLAFWANRFTAHGVEHGAVYHRDGRSVLDFEDFEGTQLSLVDDGGEGEFTPWSESTVLAGHQIRGLGYVMFTVPEAEPTAAFLRDTLGVRLAREYKLEDAENAAVQVWEMGKGGVHAELHMVVRTDLPRARYGAGGVHHLAVRTGSDDAMREWDARIRGDGYKTSGEVDRHYFQSLYVRERNGILFELATDGPGFDVDRPLDGDYLSLPPFLEPRRQEIEAALAPLTYNSSAA